MIEEWPEESPVVLAVHDPQKQEHLWEAPGQYGLEFRGPRALAMARAAGPSMGEGAALELAYAELRDLRTSHALHVRPALRAVIDPGMLVSAILAPGGIAAAIVDAWLEGDFTLIVSPMLLDELEQVLRRPRFADRLPEDCVTALIALVRDRAELVADPPARSGPTLDSRDEYLDALVLAAGATHLVTRDRVDRVDDIARLRHDATA